jgi:hypothetical protein
MGASITTKPQKFQLVEVNISVSIANLNDKLTLNVIPTCIVASK